VIFALLILYPPKVSAIITVNELQSLGEEANAILGADFNMDGIPDTVIIGTISKSIAFGRYSWEIKVSNVNALTIADLNEDGYMNEVIIAGRDIVAVDSTGREIWRAPDLRGYSALAGDLDGDGYNDEVVIGAWNMIYAFSKDGTIIWNYSTETSKNIKSIAITEDYIVAGVGQMLLGLGFNGKLMWSKVLPETIIAIAPIDSESTGTLDGIVVASFDGTKWAHVRSFSMSGAEKGLDWKHFYEREIQLTMKPIDKYSHGKMDHVIFNLDDGIYWATSGGIVGSISGRRLGFGLADFDGDGILDDIIAGRDSLERNPGAIIAYNAYGVELDSSNTTGGSTIAALDYNYDGIAGDVIAVSNYEKKVYSVITQVSDTTTSTIPQTTQPPTTTPPPTQAPTTAPPQAVEISVDLGPDKTISVGEEITLSPTAIPSTAGGRIVSYIWTEEGKFLGDTPSITLTLEEGTHNITVKVTDDSGASATDSILVTVNPKPTSSEVDSDSDGLSDQQEEILGTDPHNPDTDGDGIIDSKDPNPLAPGGGSLLPLEELKPLLKYLKWIAIAAVGIFLIIYIREKILDFLWERQQDWGE
jgi:hypothetical protein